MIQFIINLSIISAVAIFQPAFILHVDGRSHHLLFQLQIEKSRVRPGGHLSPHGRHRQEGHDRKSGRAGHKLPQRVQVSGWGFRQ